MKKFIFGLFLTSQLAFGIGRITLEPAYHYGTGQVEPKIGLAVYEHLFLDVYYDAWLGGGWYPGSANNVFWGSFTQNVRLPLGKNLALLPGVILRQSSSRSPDLQSFLSASEVHVGLEYQLW